MFNDMTYLLQIGFPVLLLFLYSAQLLFEWFRGQVRDAVESVESSFLRVEQIFPKYTR